MRYLFEPNTPAVPVMHTDALFPVHRIYCVGRNYVEHAKEMGWTGREAPFFFMKPADAILPVAVGTIGEMPYPTMTSNLHHELSLSSLSVKADQIFQLSLPPSMFLAMPWVWI